LEKDVSQASINGVNRSGAFAEDERIRSAKTIATVVYALQAASFLPFMPWITSLIAVIINYVKKEDVQGTWLESHFQWQLRTFWFGLLWGLLGLITYFFIVGYFILFAYFVWDIYRIVKGWLRLADGKPMYVGS
jgi:uncharacterized membrane protein